MSLNRRIAIDVKNIEHVGSFEVLTRRANQRSILNFEIMSNRKALMRHLGEAHEKYNLIGKAEKDFYYLIARSLSSTRNDCGQRPVQNGNGDCFLHSELIKNHSRFHVPAYRTFIGRGIYNNHMSDRLDMCFGTQLDVRLAFGQEPYTYADTCIHNMVAIDIAKAEDLGLMKGIRSGTLTTWSMGCDIEAAECSICGNRYARQEDIVCEHIARLKGDELVCETDKHGWKGARIAACDLLYGPTFVELSLVSVPADHMSETIEALGDINNERKAASLSETINIPTYFSPGEHVSIRENSDVKKNDDGTYTAYHCREYREIFADPNSAQRRIDELSTSNKTASSRPKIIERKLSSKVPKNSLIEISRITRGRS